MQNHNKKYVLKYNDQNGGLVQNNSDTGAGAILIENYKNKNGRRDAAVILFRNKHTTNYADPGGIRENIRNTNRREDLKNTASRELMEESGNFFRISQNTFDNNCAVRHGQYVGFFLQVSSKKGISSKHYYDNINRNNINNNAYNNIHNMHSWRETDGITRVYITDLINGNINNIRGNMKINDANGNQITISGRTKALIRNALQSNLINYNGIANGQTISLHYGIPCGKHPLGINNLNTVCYWI